MIAGQGDLEGDVPAGLVIASEVLEMERKVALDWRRTLFDGPGAVMGRARHGLRRVVCGVRSLLCWDDLVCGVVRRYRVLERVGRMNHFRSHRRLCWRVVLVAEVELLVVLVCRGGVPAFLSLWWHMMIVVWAVERYAVESC